MNFRRHSNNNEAARPATQTRIKKVASVFDAPRDYINSPMIISSEVEKNGKMRSGGRDERKMTGISNITRPAKVISRCEI
jgi:hypothetical protein